MKRKYQVRAIDQNGDAWTFGTDNRDAAHDMIEWFQSSGFVETRLFKIARDPNMAPPMISGVMTAGKRALTRLAG